MNCEELNSGTNVSLILSIVVTLGTVVSYIPQHYRIISLKSSAGISPLYMLLGGISSFSTVVNSLIMHAPIFGCGSQVPFSKFLNGIIGFIQVTFQWMSFFLIVILFIVYFPPEDKEEVDGIAWKRVKYCRNILAAFMAASILLALFMLGIQSEKAVIFAKLLGILAVIMSIIQFVPQIWRTLHLRRAGALSIPAMSIQAPGSFVFCLSIALTPKSDWSTWMPYFVGGCLQGTLLFLCLRFRNHPHSAELVPSSSEEENV